MLRYTITINIQYINLSISTLLPVGVGVKVPAGSLLNSQATQLTIGAQST